MSAQTAQPKLSRHDLEAMIIERTWKDPSFKKEFVSDPKATIEKYSEQKLPSEVKIFVHEEDANTLHISLPPAPSTMNELSEDDLERVAGGTEIAFTLAIVGIGISVATASIGVGASLTTSPKHGGW